MTGPGWIRNADEHQMINRTNVIGMVQQLVLAVGTRVYGLGYRRRRRQLREGYLQAPIIARTCLSDLSGLGLTRGTRW